MSMRYSFALEERSGYISPNQSIEATFVAIGLHPSPPR